jgi:hypothetical protein
MPPWHGARQKGCVGLGADFGRDGCLRRGVRQLVVADHAGHFFDQVFFDLQIKAVRRRRDRDGAITFGQGQTQSASASLHCVLRQRHAHDFGGTRHAQGDRFCGRHGDLLVINGAAGGLWGTANIDDELGNALDMLHRQLGSTPRSKAVTGIGRKIKAARTPCNGFGPPKCGFHIHVVCTI